MFRREPIRSRKLLDSAKGAPCTMEVPGVCCHDPSTTVSAHVHDETFGAGIKADDCSTIHACLRCHNWLDRSEWLGKMGVEGVLRIIIRAIQRTIRYRVLHGFIQIDLDNPKPFHSRPTKPRKPKEKRTKVSAGRKLEGRSEWPAGRKMPSRRKPS